MGCGSSRWRPFWYKMKLIWLSMVLKKMPKDMETHKFLEMDKKAHSSIILNLSDKDLREVATRTSVKAMWDKLEVLYMKKSIENRIYVKQSLYMLQMVEDDIDGENLERTLGKRDQQDSERRSRGRIEQHYKIDILRVIPDEFIKQLNQPLAKAVYLLGHYNMPWIASVRNKEDKWCFAEGWSKFVEGMKIEDGDFLLFEYFIKGFFDVKAFDSSGKERVKEKDLSDITDKDNKVADGCDNNKNVRNLNNYDEDEAERVPEQVIRDNNVQVNGEGHEINEGDEEHVPEDSILMIEDANEVNEVGNEYLYNGFVQATKEVHEVVEGADEYVSIDNVEVINESVPINSVEMTEEIHEANEDNHVQNNQEVELININGIGGENLEINLAARDQEDSERRSRDRLVQRNGIDIFRAGLAPQPRNPYFVTGVMDRRQGNLFVPKNVVKDNVIDFSKKAHFIDPTGRRFMARCKQWKDGRIVISGGWRKVCTFNYIKKDDKCICELVEGDDELAIHVTVVRGNDIQG
ncbi:B3 domain-containing protein At4g34400-like [Andrographis paniculata]|uniref:B3 domain-containing protein At4g34400-like n=1 Tax=Andrographis paniculata TaxID=175694 RepID=UPI0021E6F6F5|nr:B3 domain-containing protein At4g34400-like [Andrographis paniculata]